MEIHFLCLSSDYSLITYLHIFVYELVESAHVSLPFKGAYWISSNIAIAIFNFSLLLPLQFAKLDHKLHKLTNWKIIKLKPLLKFLTTNSQRLVIITKIYFIYTLRTIKIFQSIVQTYKDRLSNVYLHVLYVVN